MAGERKKTQPLPLSFQKKKQTLSLFCRIIALSVPAGAAAPSSAEAASLPCEVTPLRLALEPRNGGGNGNGNGGEESGTVYAAVALAGGGVARLEVKLSSSSSPPSLALRSGAKENGKEAAAAAETEAPTKQQQPPPSSPSRMNAAFGSPSKKKEQQQQQQEQQQKKREEGGGGKSGHSPVGAAGRAVAGLTAAAVGALPRVLFRTFSGNNVDSAASSAAGANVEVKALAFSRDASLLACGGEDGVVRLLSWPALLPVGDEVKPASAVSSSSSSSSSSRNSDGDGVRDLDFGPSSTDGGAHLLAVVLDSGAASVWRVGARISSSSPLATLPPPPATTAAGASKGSSSSRNRRPGGQPPRPPRPPTVARLRFDRAPPPATVRLLAAVNDPSPSAGGGFLAAVSARATSSPADPGAPPLALSWAPPLPALLLPRSPSSSEDAAPPPPPPSPTTEKALPPPKKVLSSPITAFDLSACGRLVGAGSSDGDVVVARSHDLGVVATTRGKHMVFVTAVAFSPTNAAAGTPPALLSVSADASAALTRAPPSSLLPRSDCKACKGCAVVVRALVSVLPLLAALLVLLLFVAEAAASGRAGGAACRAAAPPAANPLSLLLRSLGLSSSAASRPHRLSPREHFEGVTAKFAALASSKCRTALAERLRAAGGPGGFFLGGGGDGEL